MKALSLFMTAILIATTVNALPRGYQVLPSEGIQGFLYYEDQPSVGEPVPINFKETIAKGNVVVLHLWATSCPSCVEELKQIQEAAHAFSQQPIEFVVLSLNDPQAGVLRNYFTRLQYDHLKPYHRPGMSRPAVKGLPTTLFFNRSGKLVGRIEGPAAWQSDDMVRLLKRLCSEEWSTIAGEDADAGLLTSLWQKVQQWFS